MSFSNRVQRRRQGGLRDGGRRDHDRLPHPVRSEIGYALPIHPGIYGLQYSYTDSLDRGYSYSGSVRVLSNADFQSLMAAETALL